MREDNRAIIRASSAASKAADYLLAFRDRELTEAPVSPPCFSILIFLQSKWCSHDRSCQPTFGAWYQSGLWFDRRMA
jgi:hypothetical protein